MVSKGPPDTLSNGNVTLGVGGGCEIPVDNTGSNNKEIASKGKSKHPEETKENVVVEKLSEALPGDGSSVGSIIKFNNFNSASAVKINLGNNVISNKENGKNDRVNGNQNDLHIGLHEGSGSLDNGNGFSDILRETAHQESINNSNTPENVSSNLKEVSS